MTNIPTITKVFVDTNVFVALRDDRDPTHLRARELLTKLAEAKVIFVTSSDVIAETATVLARKLGKGQSSEFLKSIGSMAIEIFVDEKLHQATRRYFQRVRSKNISFVDCSSVMVMRSNKIRYVFGFDDDFRKLGVRLVEELGQ